MAFNSRYAPDITGCPASSVGNTAADSNTNAITAFSLPSSNGPVNGTIIGESISVTMPFGTNPAVSLIATLPQLEHVHVYKIQQQVMSGQQQVRHLLFGEIGVITIAEQDVTMLDVQQA